MGVRGLCVVCFYPPILLVDTSVEEGDLFFRPGGCELDGWVMGIDVDECLQVSCTVGPDYKDIIDVAPPHHGL